MQTVYTMPPAGPPAGSRLPGNVLITRRTRRRNRDAVRGEKPRLFPARSKQPAGWLLSPAKVAPFAGLSKGPQAAFDRQRIVAGAFQPINQRGSLRPGLPASPAC